MSYSYIILSIHGLSPKPPLTILERDSKRAVIEGLIRNLDDTRKDINLRSVYWATKQLNPDPEPYEKASGTGPFRTYTQGKADILKKLTLTVTGKVIEERKIYKTTRGVADRVLESKFNDLHQYYADMAFRRKVQGELKNMLLDARNLNVRIMLVAHSMGSIIAYDVLRDLGKTDPHFVLDHLVTLGSPLGFYEVRSRMLKDFGTLRTPSIVRKWDNFADKRDHDAHLADEYDTNDLGIKVNDDLVWNEYVGPSPKRKPNPHKIYGYLRTPEVSRIIHRFI
jgi:hypothetical protein